MFNFGGQSILVNIAQVVGFVAFFISLTTYHFRKKNRVMQVQLITSILYAIHFLLLGGLSAGIAKIIAIVRTLLVLDKDIHKRKTNIPMYILIGIYIISGALTFSAWYSIIPIIAGIGYFIAIWKFKKVQKIRFAALPTYPLWIVYDLFVGSAAGLLSDSLGMISTSIAIYRYRKKKEKKTKIRKSQANH